MITQSLRTLVSSATTHAERFNNDEDHTVAAALLTRSGKHVLGLNAYHFLGGPCGEITALANHAATHPSDPVVAVVAVYGPTGQVIAPCGKCRQVLYDLDPTIQCVVRGSNGLEALSITDLLPHAFDVQAIEQEQRIYMWEGYERAVRNGAKRQTIRIDDPFHEGPATLVFEKENGEVVTIPARVTSIITVRRCDLSDEQARNDGFESLVELQAALDMYYPGLESEDMTDVVNFELQ